MNTSGLVVAAALTLSTGTVFATAFDNSAPSGSTAGLLWRNSPNEVESFAGVVATDPSRSWAVPAPVSPATMSPAADAFSETDPARRARIEAPPPPAAEVSAMDADPMEGIIPVPEPSVSTMLLAGLGAIALIGLRRRIH